MKYIHFLGIGGSGTSAIAAIAEAQGYKITGCDKVINNEFTKNFKSTQLFEGHSKEHLSNVDILAVTPAIFSLDPNNEELLEAKEKNIPVMTWQKFMGEYLEKDKFVIAVCGTHGKSTTTAMIGQLLEDAGLDPTVELGAIIPRWNSNYRIGKSKYFVTEADEFNDNFLATHPNMAVVTTIEMDHPEYFKDFESYKESFEKFLMQTKKGTIVANISDPNVSEVIKHVMKEISVTAIDYSKSDFGLDLKIPGKHNLLNASAAFQVGLGLGVDPNIIRESLNNYRGIGRRFEFIGNYNGATIFSDFAHHPTEIEKTIEAAKEKFPDRKLIVIFQPHMFSRTKALFDDFVKVLKNLPADQIIITDIYPSREVDTGVVNSSQLVESANKENINYMPKDDNLLNGIKEIIKSENIVFFVGAGDIDYYARNLIHK